MTIILVRHGETLLNVGRTLQPANTPLAPNGHAQAAAVAQRLAALRPAAILSSDLPRALQTAQAIAAATGLPIETTPLLHERNFGDLRGRPYDTLGFDPLTMDDAPLNGESAALFHARAAQAFALAVARRAAQGGPLIVVTHGLLIRSLLARVVNAAEVDGVPHRLGNTSVTIVAATAPHAVEVLDCTRHLDGASDDRQGLSGG